MEVPGEILISLFENKGTDLDWILTTCYVMWYTASNWIAASRPMIKSYSSRMPTTRTKN